MAKTTSLSPNIESALCYLPVVGWIGAILMLIIEKDAGVRLDAVQGILLTVTLWLLMAVLGGTIILAILVPVVGIGGFVLQLYYAYMAYQGKAITIPVLSELAKKVLQNISA